MPMQKGKGPSIYKKGKTSICQFGCLRCGDLCGSKALLYKIEWSYFQSIENSRL